MLEKIPSPRGVQPSGMPCWNGNQEKLPPLHNNNNVLPQRSPLRPRRSQLGDESRAILEYRARSLRNMNKSIDLQRVYDTSYRPTIRFPKEDRTALTTIKPQFIKATSVHNKENNRKVRFHFLVFSILTTVLQCLIDPNASNVQYFSGA